MSNKEQCFLIILFLLCGSICAQEKIDVEGAIKIGHHESSSPEEGTIRFNKHNKDFEGLTDTSWKSLTKNSHSINGTNTLVDVDGNEYRTIQIGTQIWMRENLRTSRLRNSSLIEERSLPSAWAASEDDEQPAWCWYDNDPRHEAIYGKLYNWYAVKTGKLCPSGWHVPSEAEFDVMLDFLSMQLTASSDPHNNGNMLKSANSFTRSGMWDEGSFGNNASGFTALPSGIRDRLDPYGIGERADFWSSTEIFPSGLVGEGASHLRLWYNNNTSLISNGSKYRGKSIRCLKD